MQRFRGRKEKALEALLEAKTLTEAAERAGIAKSTLWRWLGDPQFQAGFRERRTEITRQIVARLRVAGTRAAAVLQELADDPEAPASARVSAARAILENAFRGFELEDLEARIAGLEQSIFGAQNNE